MGKLRRCFYQWSIPFCGFILENRPRQLRRVGGGALARLPPSAAQTVRAVFPHTAFTKTHASGVQSKGSTESSSPARTRRTAWFPATVASHRSAIACIDATECAAQSSRRAGGRAFGHGLACSVMSPSPQHGIQSLDQLLGLERHASPGKRAYLIHETADRFLPRDGVQRPRLSTTADLARWQPKLLAALDLVPKKFESLPDMHDPRLLRMQLHAQFIQNPKRRGHCRPRFCCRLAGRYPVVGVP